MAEPGSTLPVAPRVIRNESGEASTSAEASTAVKVRTRSFSDFLDGCLAVLIAFRNSISYTESDRAICDTTIAALRPIRQNDAEHSHYRQLFCWPQESRWNLQDFAGAVREPYSGFKKDWSRLWNVVDMQLDSRPFDYGADADMTNVFPNVLTPELRELAGLRERTNRFPQSDPEHEHEMILSLKRQRVLEASYRNIQSQLEKSLSEVENFPEYRRRFIGVHDVMQRFLLWEADIKQLRLDDDIWKFVSMDEVMKTIWERRLAELGHTIQTLVNIKGWSSISDADVESTVDSCRQQITGLAYPIFAMQPRGDQAGIVNSIKAELRKIDEKQGVRVVDYSQPDPIETKSALDLIELPSDLSEPFYAGKVIPTLPIQRSWLVSSLWKDLDSSLRRGIAPPRGGTSTFLDSTTSDGISILGAVVRYPKTEPRLIFDGHTQHPKTYSLATFLLESNFVEELDKLCGPSRVLDSCLKQLFGGNLEHEVALSMRDSSGVQRPYIAVRLLSNPERYFHNSIEEFYDDKFGDDDRRRIRFAQGGVVRFTERDFLIIGTMCVHSGRANESVLFAVLLRAIVNGGVQPRTVGMMQQPISPGDRVPRTTFLGYRRWADDAGPYWLGDVLILD